MKHQAPPHSEDIAETIKDLTAVLEKNRDILLAADCEIEELIERLESLKVYRQEIEAEDEAFAPAYDESKGD